MTEEEKNMFVNEVNCSIYWDNNNQIDPFESALSSMVSSPTASNGCQSENNNVQVRELIGRLGTICNSSNNTSCYSTPLNSPPELKYLSIMENTNFPPFSTDRGFAERAAAFSCFNQWKLDAAEASSVRNGSSISEQIPTVSNSRKRKSIPKGSKGKQLSGTAPAKHPNNIGSENSESSAKRSKSQEEEDEEKLNQKQPHDDDNNNSKTSEAPKDYIHVRARRGQATDAHSLAERVRREKISEKMKVLQDLVPGCNKVTGKAVMLDEIINYVQSLQRQAEFLSMKLATVNPTMDFNMEPLISHSKDMFPSRGSLPHNIYPSGSYHFQSQHNATHSGTEANNIYPPIDSFSDYANPFQVSTYWEDDLHRVVQMGFDQTDTQKFHEIILPTAQMKVEL